MDAHGIEELDRLFRLLRGIVGEADVQRLAAVDSLRQRTHGLLKRCLRIHAVVIEQIHVFNTHPFQARIQAGKQIFTRTAAPIRPRLHGVSCLGRNEQLVPIGGKILMKDPAECLLGTSERRAVVVSKVKIRHAKVERPADNIARVVIDVIATEIVPQSKCDCAQ